MDLSLAGWSDTKGSYTLLTFKLRITEVCDEGARNPRLFRLGESTFELGQVLGTHAYLDTVAGLVLGDCFGAQSLRSSVLIAPVVAISRTEV